MPVAAYALGGKVTYPDGTPAVSAQVKVIVNDTSGNPNSSDGKVVVDQEGNPASDVKGAVTIICDAAGRFTFPDLVFTDALIQIKAPDDRNFGSVKLPAAVFATEDLAIVLQPK